MNTTTITTTTTITISTIGFMNVINNNRDFYHDIQHNNIPDYDILITNPPYSCDHKLKLLNFLKNNNNHHDDHHQHRQKKQQQQHHYHHHGNRPFALLLPAYIATKSYWKDFLSSFNNNNNNSNNNNNYNNSNNNNNDNNNININKVRISPNLSSTIIPTSASTFKKLNNQTQSIMNILNMNMNIMYLLPPDYYNYSHPEGTGKDIPPFYSIWFIGMIDNNDNHDNNVVDNTYGYNNSRYL